MDLKRHEIETILGWASGVDSEWGLHEDERRLVARLRAEAYPSEVLDNLGMSR